MRKLRERYAVQDRETTPELERLLSDWQSERNRLPTHLRKPPGNLDGGVEIILPLRGIRPKYELSCLMIVRRLLSATTHRSARRITGD